MKEEEKKDVAVVHEHSTTDIGQRRESRNRNQWTILLEFIINNPEDDKKDVCARNHANSANRRFSQDCDAALHIHVHLSQADIARSPSFDVFRPRFATLVCIRLLASFTRTHTLSLLTS